MMYDSIGKDNDPSESINDNLTNQSTDKSYLSTLVEHMMKEMGIPFFDDRTCHMLVDLLQRESLSLLKSSVQNSEQRLSSEKEKLLLGNNSTSNLTKPNMKVTEEDAQLACQEYINNNVIQPGINKDLLDVQKYANHVRLASKHIISGNKPKSFSAYKNEDEMGQFPTGPVPQLPENLSLNTLVITIHIDDIYIENNNILLLQLPHWDIKLKENK